MDDLGYEGRGQRILELERELAEARQGIRVACWWCGRSPQDEPAIQLRRLNPKGIRGVFQCQHCVTDDDKARRGILECQTREISLRRLVMIAACNLRESGRGDVADMILTEPIMQETT